MFIRAATEYDYKNLVELRRQTYETELAIQDAGYRDRFTEAISKTLILTDGIKIAASVRIAFSITEKRFYLSYLTIAENYRYRNANALLLGALIFALRMNRVHFVEADAHDGVVEMYERFGFRRSGSPFNKPGFNCRWWPMVYQVQSNAELEARLIRMVDEYIDNACLQWCFRPRIWIVPSLKFEAFVSEIMQRFNFGADLPILSPCNDVGCVLPGTERWEDRSAYGVRTADQDGPPACPCAGLSPPEHDWDSGDILVAEEQPEILAIARVYASLTRKRVVRSIDDLPLNSKSVYIVGGSAFVSEAKDLVISRALDVGIGLLPGCPHFVSAMLIKSVVVHLNATWLVNNATMKIPVVRFMRASNLKRLGTLADSATTHVVSNVSDQLWFEIEAKLQAGYRIGDSVGKCHTGEEIFGDPSIRFCSSLEAS